MAHEEQLPGDQTPGEEVPATTDEAQATADELTVEDILSAEQSLSLIHI